ncbi:gametocyte-specific factor 1 isoform X2 [Papio anubis]|uniref:gametocyte-specific factor 1 isoform X2 n=1 Tax=Papio anubis TaxID=9555 RepID=UPI0004F21C48|nr:gametocyte-specific factor 1 isoform X2 [Papio anubis]
MVGRQELSDLNGKLIHITGLKALGFSSFISNMEETYTDSLDPEKLLQCPYDKNHQIRACRFPYHLIKCRKNHPDVASKLATCPFNARHQVPRAEISHHISSCDDRSCIEQDVVNQTRSLRQETLAESTWQCPPCDEDWDKDLWEQTSTPFVWGTTHYSDNNRWKCTVTEYLSHQMPDPKRLLLLATSGFFIFLLI